MAALVATGCRAIQTIADTPGNVARAVLPGSDDPGKTPLTELHPELLRAADFTIQRFRVAATRFYESADDVDVQLKALDWRSKATSAVLEAATGPEPLSGMLDLMTVVKSARLLADDQLDAEEWPEAHELFVRAAESSEKRVWESLGLFFTPEELDQFRSAFDTWEDQLRASGGAVGDDPPTFRDIVSTLDRSSATRKGLFGIVRLDPLAGLEPVEREVALTRQFAERTLFWGQRLQLLVEDQVAVAAIQAQRLPAVVSVIEDVDRVSAAVDRVSKTVEELPDIVRAEREAALGQASTEINGLVDSSLERASAEITAQREGLVRDLETAEEPLSALLQDSQSTLDAAHATSTELNALVAAVGGLVDRFEPASDAEAPVPALDEPSVPARPFDITEYGDVAERLTAAAAELRELVTTLDASLPEVEALVDTAVSRADRSVDHIAFRLLQLGLALIGAIAIAVVGVRWLGRRGAT